MRHISYRTEVARLELHLFSNLTQNRRSFSGDLDPIQKTRREISTADLGRQTRWKLKFFALHESKRKPNRHRFEKAFFC